MKNVCTKWGYEMRGVSFQIGEVGDVAKVIPLDKFFLRDPKPFSAVVDNRVLMRVAVDRISAGRSGEKVGK